MTIRRRRARAWGFAIACLTVSGRLFAQSTGLYAPMLPSNHALIITVSEYQRSPLPGVLTDRKLANELARRFGVPAENIVELSEQQVTREGLKQALASMSQVVMPGDKLYVYFSGHGARFFSKASGQCMESIVMQDMHVVTNTEFANMLKPLSAKTDKTIVMLDSCHSGGVAQAASSRDLASGTERRAKYLPDASSPQCSLAVNDRSFSQVRGADLDTTDNNLVILAAASTFASAIATIVAQRTGHRYAVPFTVALLTIIVIVFCELAPKIYAASNPEGVALHAARIYRVLVLITRPALWLTNTLANGFLWLARTLPAPALAYAAHIALGLAAAALILKQDRDDGTILYAVVLAVAAASSLWQAKRRAPLRSTRASTSGSSTSRLPVLEPRKIFTPAQPSRFSSTPS